MSNDYYNPSGSPSTGSSGSSATMRAEFVSAQAGFDKLPPLNTHGNEYVRVNSGGTALESRNNTQVRSDLNLVPGTDVQAWDADLDALAALDATVGILIKTAAATYARRNLVGTANEITVTNGNGVAGNITVSLPAALTFTGKTVTGGTFNNVAVTNTSSPIAVNSGGTGLSSAGNANNVLVSNGTAWVSGLSPANGALHSVQIFTSNGNYVAPTGLVRALVIVTGGGASGGGSAANAAGSVSAATGGAGGGTSIKVVSAATIGASQTVTIGAGGGAAGAGSNGNNGNTTSFGAIISATGGSAGLAGGSTATAQPTESAAPPTGGAGSSGDINLTGGPGGMGFQFSAANRVSAGKGGDSYWGFGGVPGASNTSGTGNQAAANAYGAGSSGAQGLGTAAAQASTAGRDGICVVWEYF